MSKFIDLTGKIFGLLTVIEKSHIVDKNTKRAKTYWKCQCECGNIHVVNGQNLRDKITRSCGCYFMSYRRKSEPMIVSAYAVYNHAGMYSEADITFEKFLELSQQNCHYCNAPPSNRVNKISNKKRNRYDEYWFTYNGLDRIDSSKLHTIENCVPCCFTCNIAKRNMSLSQFLDWLERAYNHSIKPKKN